MTDKNEMNWITETIRFTFFASPDSQINSPETWWETFVGETPESITNQPKSGTVNMVGLLQEGEVKLIINVQPDRIDWQLIPNTPPTTDTPDNIGNLDEAMPLILNPVINWLEGTGIDIERFAFGALLLSVADGKVDSYEKLDKLLPNVEMDPQGSSDFIFQINRPRDSNCISDLKINRLSKWNAMTFARFKLSQPDSDGVAPPVQSSTTLSACRLELDISTPPKSTEPIPKNKYNDIIKELINLGQEISTNGDIK